MKITIANLTSSALDVCYCMEFGSFVYVSTRLHRLSKLRTRDKLQSFNSLNYVVLRSGSKFRVKSVNFWHTYRATFRRLFPTVFVAQNLYNKQSDSKISQNRLRKSVCPPKTLQGDRSDLDNDLLLMSLILENWIHSELEHSFSRTFWHSN